MKTPARYFIDPKDNTATVGLSHVIRGGPGLKKNFVLPGLSLV